MARGQQQTYLGYTREELQRQHAEALQFEATLLGKVAAQRARLEALEAVARKAGERLDTAEAAGADLLSMSDLRVAHLAALEVLPDHAAALSSLRNRAEGARRTAFELAQAVQIMEAQNGTREERIALGRARKGWYL